MRSIRSKGFTLVELLVAVGIIGVLASVSVVSVNSIRQKSRDAKRLSDVKEVQSALEVYLTNRSTYPLGSDAAAATTLGEAAKDTLCNNDNGFVADTAAANCTQPIFMARVNTNPTPGGVNYVYQATGCNNNALPCTGYTLAFRLESGAGSLNAGAYSASPDGIVRTGD